MCERVVLATGTTKKSYNTGGFYWMLFPAAAGALIGPQEKLQQGIFTQWYASPGKLPQNSFY